jgi:phosphomannomutase
MSIYDPSIFRAYDVRGVYPSQMNEQVAYAAGQAFVAITNAKTVVVGRDVRSTGESLQNAMIQGITEAGGNVIEVGVISTEMLYFASATLECDGGMSITASHNPSEWNGIKFIGKDAKPLTKEDVLGEIYTFIQESRKVSQFEKGQVTHKDILTDYALYLKKFTPTDLSNLKIVANPNFGASGKVADLVVKDLPVELIRLNWNEDGSFPKGTPDPLLPKNRVEIEQTIQSQQANFGVAWDADADRAFFYDEKGRFFHGYYITALLIKHFLTQQSGQNVVCERRLTWANLDTAKEFGGTVVFSRTGHGYIKAAMRENEAVFGGETSGHYYFRDFFFCDNGMVSFLIILGMFAAEIKAGRTVSALLDYYLENYPISIQEMNYITPHAKEIMDGAAAKYADAEQNHVDGLSVEYPDWRFNLRTSSNEPVLRFNIEAHTTADLDSRKKEVMDYIEGFGAELRND